MCDAQIQLSQSSELRAVLPMEAEGALHSDGVWDGSARKAGVAGDITDEFIRRDYLANLGGHPLSEVA